MSTALILAITLRFKLYNTGVNRQEIVRMNEAQAIKLAQQPVTRKFPNEEAVRLRLATVLKALDYDVEPEYGVQSGGWMDIYLPQRRVVIETKRTGEAHPDSVRDPERNASSVSAKLSAKCRKNS